MNTQSSRIERHIEIDCEDTTAVDWLVNASQLSKQRIKQAMNKGAVWLTRGKSTNRLRRATRKPLTGDSLHLYYDEKVLSAIPPEAKLIADEGAYSVWFKPCGMLSQGSKWGDHCAINRFVEKNLSPERPAFVVHRLDRAATGLIIIAHKKTIAAQLSELFQKRKVEKHYRVIVHNKFPDDVMTIDRDIDGKQAVSHIQLLEYDPVKNLSLLDVSIETGRKHQIRIHLSESGFPVVGDRLYGDKADKQDLQLCAVSLAFTCPLTKEKRQFLLPKESTPFL
jgi:tRNA pseudouridine32 synthase/23S rRNA pseudouridine746 synthase